MVLCTVPLHSTNAAESEPLRLARIALQDACANPFEPAVTADALRAETPAPAEAVIARGRKLGQRFRFDTELYRIIIEQLMRNKRLAGVRILIHDQTNNPLLFVAADPKCQVRMARQVEYDGEKRAQNLRTLDTDLTPSGPADPLDPPVPDGKDPGGVRIALVDAGVNYLLPTITARLARDESGKLIGFDYWDMDPRPFDSHPVPSLFFTQRHGTRTASLLLSEAPEIALVPYRYPRPDMSRMEQLITHAHKHQIRVIGLPLGGNRESEWRVFAQTAKDHPDILFVASAGNFGRDIDRTPVYPAALTLANLLVVSSAEDHIGPAERTNWGARSVDLLVPAEQLTAIDFNGRSLQVSGSSYAVSRIVALAARLAAQHANWRAAEIKQAILDRALSLPHLKKFVSVGYLPDPLFAPGEIIAVNKLTLALPQRKAELNLALNLVWLQDSGWQQPAIEAMVGQADAILGQCGVRLGPVTLHKIQVPPRLLDFDVHTAHSLVTELSVAKPAVYLARDTRRKDGFEGEAFGNENSKTRPWLTDTVWLVAEVQQPALALAHELFHVISNNGDHAKENGNLMNIRTSSAATRLTAAQCEMMRANGLSAKLLLKNDR